MSHAAPGGVVVAGRDDRSTLSVCRSLARAGIPVTVATVDRARALTASRFVRDLARVPHPVREQEAFVHAVIELARNRGARLVMPVDDGSLLALEVHRDLLEQVARLAAAPSPAVRNVLDKPRNLRLARDLGIPCPAQFELEHLDQVPELIDRLGFPLVLKNPGPLTEHGRHLSFRFLVARDERELRDHLAAHCPPGALPYAQELLRGSIRNVCCFALDGELVAAHDYVSLSRWGGESVLREISPADERARAHAAQLLRALGWNGVAHVGFFERESDRMLLYMEVNARFWASTEGSVRAGWDFPRWTHDYFTTGARPITPPLRVGSRTCWRAGDLRALADAFHGGDVSSYNADGRVRAVRRYLASFRPGTSSDVFRLDDPVPELVEHLRLARDATRWARHRVRPR